MGGRRHPRTRVKKEGKLEPQTQTCPEVNVYYRFSERSCLPSNTSLVYYHLMFFLFFFSFCPEWEILWFSFTALLLVCNNLAYCAEDGVGINVADIYGHRKICPGDCLKHQNFTTLLKLLHCSSFTVVHWYVSITLFSCSPIKGLQNASRA